MVEIGHTPPANQKVSIGSFIWELWESRNFSPKVEMSCMYFSNVSSVSYITMTNIQMSFTFLQNNSHTHKIIWIHQGTKS